MTGEAIKTVLVEGVGWPEVGELPARFKQDYVKPLRVFKPKKKVARNKYSTDLDDKFNEWLSKPQPVRSKK